MIDKKFYWLDTRTLAVILRPMDRVEFRFLRHSCGKRDAGAYFPTLGMPERLIRLNHLQRGKRLQLDLPVCIINTWDWLRQTNSVSNRTIISIAEAFNYLSVLNLNSSWTFKDIHVYSGKFCPVSRAGGLIWILYIVHNPENRILCSHTNFQKKSKNQKIQRKV